MPAVPPILTQQYTASTHYIPTYVPLSNDCGCRRLLLTYAFGRPQKSIGHIFHGYAHTYRNSLGVSDMLTTLSHRFCLLIELTLLYHRPLGMSSIF